MPRAEPSSLQVDLFGDVAPVAVVPRSRRPVRLHPVETGLEEYRAEVATALDDLRRSIEDAVGDLDVALDHVDDGEKYCAIEALGEALDRALAAARRELELG